MSNLDIRDELNRQTAIIEFLAQTLAIEIDYPMVARQGLAQILADVVISMENINEKLELADEV